MNRSQRRIQEELRMVERQLPLYYQKVNELERRQYELQSVLEAEDNRPSYDPRLRNYPPNRMSYQKPTFNQGSKYHEALPNFELPPKIKTLGATAKTNMVKLLGDARGKFSVLSEGMSQAVSYLDTMILVLNLMEQSGGDLQQHLVSTANSIQQQVNNPAVRTGATKRPSDYSDQNESSGGLPIEALMEIIKSPHFQQLADQLKATGLGSNN